MTAITVKHEAAAHRFTTDVDGHCAQLDYTLSGSRMSITHTGVPAQIEGRGVAAEMMRTALATARAQGWSVKPVCSYASAYIAKHPIESFPASDSPAVGGIT